MDNHRMRYLRDSVARFGRIARSKPLGSIGGFVVLILVLFALLAPVIATADPVAQDANNILLAPGPNHWLGTDNLGRDLWSRVAHGAWVSLGVGFSSIALGSVVGGFAGLLGGYYGKLADAMLQQLSDAVMAFPTLVLALGIVAILGASVMNVIVAIALVQAPRAARVVRSQTLAIKSTEYVAASKLVGQGSMQIMIRHVMPHCLAPFIVISTNALGVAIVLEASLSFLGLGIPAPEPSWGGMLAGPGRDYFNVAPWMAIWPGLAITLSVYGFNLLGDAIRDILDPYQTLH